MEAKDTVMNDDKLFAVMKGQKRSEDIIDTVMKAQAAISFKAGQKEVVEWVEMVKPRELDGDAQLNSGKPN